MRTFEPSIERSSEQQRELPRLRCEEPQVLKGQINGGGDLFWMQEVSAFFDLTHESCRLGPGGVMALQEACRQTVVQLKVKKGSQPWEALRVWGATIFLKRTDEKDVYELVPE